jgi:hypothetical protein
MFDVLVEVILPPKTVVTSQRKCKNVKTDPAKFGPIQSATDCSWQDFIVKIAVLIDSACENLSLGQTEWRWLVPANSPWLPVQNKPAYTSLLKMVTSKQAPYIIIRMSPPSGPTAVAAPASLPAAPWLASTTRHVEVLEEGEDDGEGHAKKIHFDDELEELVIQINEKYKAGLCSDHPNQQCFHHHPTDLHFILDCPKKLVWASYIQQGKASIATIPVGSNLFSAKNAAKKVVTSTLATLSPDMAAEGSVAASIPSHSLPPMPSFNLLCHQTPPSPYGFPYPFYQYPLPSPFFPPSPFTSPFYAPQTTKNTSPGLNEPRSSPPPAGGSVDDFCEWYHLGDSVRQGLEHLGFEIGDNLAVVMETQYQQAGFKTLAWTWVLRDYSKYQCDLMNA